MDPFQHVLAHPSSVSARRALAAHWKAVEDPRAELIEKQLARHDGLSLRAKKHVPQEIAELIEDHGREWAGRVADLVDEYEFELGLVSHVTMTGERFVEHAAELVALAPILHVSLDPPIDLAKVCACPSFAQVSTLLVQGGPWTGDREAIAIANSPYVRSLRAVFLGGSNITSDGLRALATSPNLQGVVWIRVTGNPGATHQTDLPNGGLQLRLHDDRHWFLEGQAADEHWTRAAMEAVRTDSPFSVSWPPSYTELAFTE